MISSISITQIIPLVSAFFVLWLGFFVWSKNKTSSLNIVFLLFSLSVTGWLFGTFVLFSYGNTDAAIIFWDKVVYSFVIFIPIFLFHFVMIFVGNKKITPMLVLSYFIFFILFLTLAFTNYFIEDVFRYDWGVHAQARIFHHIFLFLFFVYSLEIYRQLVTFYKNATGNKKQQTKFIIVGLLNFSIIGFIGFLPAYSIGVYPFSYLSGILFVSIVGYAITKYNLLNTRILAVNLLITALNIIVFSRIFVSVSREEYIINTVFFVGIFSISLILKKSINKEIEQKIKLEQASKDLKRANIELKRLDKAKSEFISIASHQLRTPLTAIKGYVSLILEGAYGKNTEETDGALNKIFLANDRLIQLVEDLLNITRIESGRLEYHMEDVQIDGILEELEDMFILRTKEKGLELTIKTLDGKAPPVKADRSKLREVISNLIDNAVKYTKEGFIHVSMEKDGSILRVIIEDSGVGISKESLTSLFTKFSRGTDDTKMYTEGTGLGLYVGKNLVESQGGRIYAESDGLGKGSKFIVEMPIVK
jgi:signal transduction histidine kinase